MQTCQFWQFFIFFISITRKQPDISRKQIKMKM